MMKRKVTIGPQDDGASGPEAKRGVGGVSAEIAKGRTCLSLPISIGGASGGASSERHQQRLAKKRAKKLKRKHQVREG